MHNQFYHKRGYLTEFVAAQLMANTPDCFHSMIDLLIILESIFVVFVGDILFDQILSYTFSSLFILTSIFYMSPIKLSDWNTSSLIFGLANYFFISWIKVWTIFGVIKLVFLGPKILVSISSLYFITQIIIVNKCYCLLYQ